MLFTPMMNYVGANLARSELVSTRQHVMLGITICSGGMLVSSFVHTYMWFMILFTTSIGFGTGLIYSSILYKAWLYFPGKEGTISGTIIAGFGLGGFVSISLSQKWLNPYGVKPSLIDSNDVSAKPYDKQIANNLPLML